MERYSSLLSKLECHFNWNIRSIVGDKELVDKLSEKIEEIAGQPWRNLLITLTLAYELYVKNETGANEKLQEVISIWGNTDDDFIMKYKDAFRHVIYSMKLFFVKDTSSENIIKEIFNYIPPYTTLPTEQKVAIIAIKAHVFSEYGPNGTKHALTLAKEAVRGNPKEGEWSFLVGKMLSRIRQFTLDHCVTEEELECLRHAYALSKSPGHAVFLAQTYCTISKALYHKLPFSKGRRILNDNEGRIIRGYNEKAYNLFKEALEGNDNKCVHINFRCARGLFNLPGEFKDIEKALKLVENTLERAPTNVYGNSIAANIYYSLKLYDKAFKHADAAEEGGSYGASIKKLQMKIDLKMDINVEETYESISKRHPEKLYKIQTAMHAISYYIFMKRNIFHALNYFFKAADWDASLDDFDYYTYWIRENTDLCFIVYNEVKSAIDSKKAKNARQHKQLRDAITVINTKYPKVTEKNLKPNLVDFLMQRVQRFPNRRNSRKPNNYTQKRNLENSFKKKNDEEVNNNVKSSKENFQQKKKQNKKNGDKKETRRRSSRTRTASESSNVSITSASSCASTSSFTRIRRNSKEACLLDIIAKDLEVANLCKEFKEANKSTETDLNLRPSQEKNKLNLGFNPKEKQSLSMGCTGWSSKSQRNENLAGLNKFGADSRNYQLRPQQNKDMSQLHKVFNKMKIETSENKRQNRSLSACEHERKPITTMQRSLNTSSDGAFGISFNESKSESECYNKKTDKRFNKNNKSFYKDVHFEENIQNPRKTFPTRESSNERGYQTTGYNRSYNQKSNYGSNSGRGRNNKVDNDRKLIRKPFNLTREDSLDSDDSASRSGNLSDRNFDRLSTSSVDSDYIRSSNKPYFSWQQKRGYTNKK